MKRKLKGSKDRFETLTSWIPSDIAKVGNVVKLRNSASEEWSENWKILEASDKFPGELVEKAERDFMRQRKQSDI